jgi:hypothetical protein
MQKVLILSTLNFLFSKFKSNARRWNLFILHFFFYTIRLGLENFVVKDTKKKIIIILSSTKLEKRAEQVLPGSKGNGGKERGQGQEGEMT